MQNIEYVFIVKRGPLIIPDELSREQRIQWQTLNQTFAPFRISDLYCDDPKLKVSSFSEVGWTSLYALSVRIAEHLRRQPVLIDTLPPEIPKHLPWTVLNTQYDSERLNIFKNYTEFLQNWGLKQLITKGLPAQGMFHQEDVGDSNKVLGFHLFRKASEVQDYVRRWHANPLIREPALRQHAFINLGAIDLICAELIENGLTHSVRNNGTPAVFIMAKICTVKSAKQDLALHRIIHHLSRSEIRLFEQSVTNQVPHLQFVVGDLGTGITGNKALQQRFAECYPHFVRPPNGFDLLKLALRGDVTTKTVDQIRNDWQSRITGVKAYNSVVHGLSEVRRYIGILHGFWRIHSQRHVLQFDYIDEASPPLDVPARFYPGTLHYISIPLHARFLLPPASTPSSPVALREFEAFDMARYISVSLEGKLSIDHEKLWKNLIAAGEQKTHLPLLVVAHVLEMVEKAQLEDLCPLIADVLHRSFHDRAVFFCGSNAIFRSELPRYTRNTAFMRPTTIVVFLGDDALTNSVVAVYCAEEYAEIEPLISRLLGGVENTELLPSEFSGRTVTVNGEKRPLWELIEKLGRENPHLLTFGRSGREFALRSRHFLDKSTHLNRLLYGGRTFEEFQLHLKRLNCLTIPQDGNERGVVLRFGKPLRTYLHLGRLLSDTKLQQAIPESFTLQLQTLPAMRPIFASAGAEFFIIGVLHPGIAVAEEIFQRPQFAKAEVIPLRRMAEIYWDVGPLSACSGKAAIIVVDFIFSGQTVNRLLDSLAYLRVKVIAVLSVLTIKSAIIQSIPVLSFSECERAEYDAFCQTTESEK